MAGLVGENFRKFAKIFLKKIAKMHYFGLFFKENLKKHALNFFAFGRKTIGWGNFEKILIFLMKVQ